MFDLGSGLCLLGAGFKGSLKRRAHGVAVRDNCATASKVFLLFPRVRVFSNQY